MKTLKVESSWRTITHQTLNTASMKVQKVIFYVVTHTNFNYLFEDLIIVSFWRINPWQNLFYPRMKQIFVYKPKTWCENVLLRTFHGSLVIFQDNWF